MNQECQLGNDAYRPSARTGGKSRLAEALEGQESFTREQVAWLMNEAMRWGYELRDEEDRGFHAGYLARVAEENATYPPADVLIRHRDIVVGVNQRTYRAECDAAARLPRPGDFKGRGQAAVDALRGGDEQAVAA